MNHIISKKAARALILADLRDTFQDEDDISEEELLRWTEEFLLDGGYELLNLVLIRLNGRWYLSEPSSEEVARQKEVRRVMAALAPSWAKVRKEAWVAE